MVRFMLKHDGALLDALFRLILVVTSSAKKYAWKQGKHSHSVHAADSQEVIKLSPFWIS